MGFRLTNDTNSVPAWISDGKLYSAYGWLKSGITLPVNVVDFPKQCIQFDTNNIMVYLMSGAYEFVLRFDGSCNLIKNGYVYSGFFLADMPVEKTKGFIKGIVKKGNSTNVSYLHNLIIEDNKTIISGVGVPFTAVIEYKNNPAFLSSSNEMLPILIVDLYSKKLVVDLGDCQVNVTGDIFISSEFITLRGYYGVGV